MSASTVWVLLGSVVVGTIVVTLVLRAKSTPRSSDLGSVSDQWVAEHRAGQDNGFAR